MWQRLKIAITGEPQTGRLPERVQRVIETQQVESERLIGWAQLVVGVTWAALYAVAPKTFSADETFAPVPVALALYIGFTVLRIFLLRQGFVQNWFLSLSVVADMTLLMGLIWSFHLQYAQPAAFYLKAPTLLYVFIFIALRALRFSPSYVLLAGGVAAFGWLAMVYYAMLEAEDGMGVTRNYIEYMTASKVLLGAEFDKVITILLTTLILAVAIVRARKLLVASVVEGAAHTDLSRFFSPEVAEQITGSEHLIQPGEGDMREAAILVCDIRNFTPLAMRSEPNALMRLLADYQSRMVTVIQRHGGTVDKFLGDGILATFGAALPTETYAADALAAVAEMRQAAADWRAERAAAGQTALDIGFAVAAGPVLFGAVGDTDRLEFTVIGDAVNLAAKLEDANKVQGVTALTDATTYELARAQGFRSDNEPECRPVTAVAGTAAPVDLVVLAP